MTASAAVAVGGAAAAVGAGAAAAIAAAAAVRGDSICFFARITSIDLCPRRGGQKRGECIFLDIYGFFADHARRSPISAEIA